MSGRVGRRAFVGKAVKAAVAAGLAPRAQAAPLASAERRRLRAAVDTLIPAEAPMPSASAVGAVAYVERLAARDPAFAALLAAGLAALEARSRASSRRGFAHANAAHRAEAMAAVEKADAAFVGTLRDAVYEAYYSRPEVWTLIGYRFRSGPRRTADLEPFDASRLARVRAMGRLHREAK